MAHIRGGGANCRRLVREEGRQLHTLARTLQSAHVCVSVSARACSQCCCPELEQRWESRGQGGKPKRVEVGCSERSSQQRAGKPRLGRPGRAAAGVRSHAHAGVSHAVRSNAHGACLMCVNVCRFSYEMRTFADVTRKLRVPQKYAIIISLSQLLSEINKESIENLSAS